MKIFLLSLIFLSVYGCNKPKTVLICGDHVCINKAEARSFFEENLSLEVKVIDKKDNFRKVIDFQKNNGWIHKSQLQKSKSAIVISEKILFKNPTKYSQPLAKINKGRLLLIQKCKKEWCKIKTGNYLGWVNKEKLWGINIIE